LLSRTLLSCVRSVAFGVFLTAGVAMEQLVAARRKKTLKRALRKATEEAVDLPRSSQLPALC